jgi:MFS family permease
LIAISPAAVAGCFGAGFVNGAFWTFAPIFAESSGLDLSQVALFMMCVMVGGAVAQWPIGLLSDRVERRWVLIGVCLIAGAAGLLLARSGGAGPSVLLAMSAAYGAAALSVWSISVAHANDLVPRRRALAVSSGLLLTFSVGAVAGPLVASVVMSRFGDAALFYHTAGSHAAIAAAVAVRMLVRPSRKDAPREVFVPVPGTTPAAFELDPRAEPGGADAGATRDALARTG